jgi:hypothetical protein
VSAKEHLYSQIQVLARQKFHEVHVYQDDEIDQLNKNRIVMHINQHLHYKAQHHANQHQSMQKRLLRQIVREMSLLCAYL